MRLWFFPIIIAAGAIAFGAFMYTQVTRHQEQLVVNKARVAREMKKPPEKREARALRTWRKYIETSQNAIPVVRVAAFGSWGGASALVLLGFWLRRREPKNLQ